MRVFYRLFNKENKKIIRCGREYCICMRDLDFKRKKDKQLYKKCYKMWYDYYHL